MREIGRGRIWEGNGEEGGLNRDGERRGRRKEGGKGRGRSRIRRGKLKEGKEVGKEGKEEQKRKKREEGKQKGKEHLTHLISSVKFRAIGRWAITMTEEVDSDNCHAE